MRLSGLVFQSIWSRAAWIPGRNALDAMTGICSWSSLLIGTKRMLGRPTASAIASASLK